MRPLYLGDRTELPDICKQFVNEHMVKKLTVDVIVNRCIINR